MSVLFLIFFAGKRVRPDFRGWSNTIVSGSTCHALHTIPWIHSL